MSNFTTMKKSFPIFIIANNIRSLANVGLFFRISDATNIERLYLCGITGHPKIPNDKRLSYQIEKETKNIEKTAIKTIPFVDWEYCENALDIIKKLKKEGVQIVAVEQTNTSESLWKTKFKFPLCLIFGHERTGIDKKILEQSDLIVEIPMIGKGKNLNVSTAYAVTIYELLRKLL
ncbi:MAG: TrmH family RNA methyltransferase [bacterium]